MLNGGLMLVDWDAAGPVSPRHEVAKEALNWSGVHLGELDPAVAHALIEGYRRTDGTYDDPRPEDFGEFVAVMLAWCEYNVRRSLGERLHDETDRALAQRQARRILTNFPRFARSLDSWAEMLR